MSLSTNSKSSPFFIVEDSVKSIFALNSFGMIRLLLATVVVFQHSLVLTGHAPMTFIGVLGDVDLGTIGVSGFFAVSGFLLFGSSQRLTSRAFVIHRFFRLFPGLWACLLVCGFIVIPIANQLSVYESSFSLIGFENSSASYLIKNSALLVFQDSIGNVFGQNIYPLAVNGSLWTLAPEFFCYMGLLILAVISRRNQLIQFTLISVALTISSFVWVMTRASENEIQSQILSPASGLAISFCTGALLAMLVELKPIRPRITPTLIGIGLWVSIGASGPLSFMVLSALIICLGTSLTNLHLSAIGRGTDISYGVYLYHFPIIQIILVSSSFGWPGLASATLLPFLSIILAGIVAFLSWTFIESPSVRFAREMTK